MSETAFIPPRNIEAERAVLGGVLLDDRTVADLPAELKPEAFYLPRHGTIFQAMLALWEHEAPIDVVSVADKAKAAGHEISVSLLFEIQEHGMPRSIAYHAGLVIAAFRQRRTVNLLREALSEIQEAPHRHDEIMSRLYSANDSVVASGAMQIQAVIVESLKRIEKAKDYRAIIPTGLSDLDRAIGGIERGELVIIAGRPSMGKTSLALDFGLNAAERGYSVLIVSVETSREKLGMRMLSRETKLNSRKFRTGILQDGDYPRLTAASGKLGGLPIHVLDRESEWGNIKREIRRRARGGLDLVILDYLTLLDLPTGRNDRRDLAVGRVANEAKRLALSLNLGFILLSQLNRKTEERTDPEPIMSDLRDSGDIEQAADVIIFPFRPFVYDPDFRPRDKAFLKVAKARDLPTGKISVRFNAEITSFSDWTEPA
jgi:replicative DNA helicase